MAGLGSAQHFEMFFFACPDFYLSVSVLSHFADGAEGDESGYCDFHGIGVLLDEILFSETVGLGDVFEHLSSEVDLITQ